MRRSRPAWRSYTGYSPGNAARNNAAWLNAAQSWPFRPARQAASGCGVTTDPNTRHNGAAGANSARWRSDRGPAAYRWSTSRSAANSSSRGTAGVAPDGRRRSHRTSANKRTCQIHLRRHDELSRAGRVQINLGLEDSIFNYSKQNYRRRNDYPELRHIRQPV